MTNVSSLKMKSVHPVKHAIPARLIKKMHHGMQEETHAISHVSPLILIAGRNK
jgi:hypothetical protein